MSADELPFKVLCKSTLPFFETIAGFDYEGPARWYAEECAKTNPHMRYRIRDCVSGTESDDVQP